MKKSAGAACCPHLPDICVHGGFRYETNMQAKPSAHSHRRAGLLRADSAARALRRGRGREKSAAGESPAGNRPVGSHRDCRRVDHRFRVEAGRLGEI